MSDIEKGEGIARKFKKLTANVAHVQRCELGAFQAMTRHWKTAADKESYLFNRMLRLHLAGGHVIHILVCDLKDGRQVIMAFVGQTLYYTLI